MRILIISNLYPTEATPNGGVFISHRVRALRARGHEVIAVALDIAPVLAARSARPIMAPPARRGDVFQHVQVSIGIPDRLALRRGQFSRVAARTADAVLDWLSGRRLDIVHAHGMYELPAGAVAQLIAEGLGINFVITCHGSDVNEVMKRNPSSYGRVFARASGVTFPSQDLLERAEQSGVRSRRTAVIPNGVDLQTFHPAPPPTVPASQASPQILFVGNLRHVKGADRLPEIFRAISADRGDVRFKIVGSGPLEQLLRREMLGMPVEFMGHLDPDGVADAMRESRIVVMPSRSEGFGCVALEAHACGIPVVATAVGGLPEVICDERLVVPESPKFVDEFAGLCVRLSRGEPFVATEPLVERARLYDWKMIAERECNFLGDGYADT